MSAREYWDNQWIRSWYQSALVLSVALFTLSCDSGPTNSPISVSPSPTPASVPGFDPHRLAGLVFDERGAPVVGAELTVPGSRPPGSVVTDAQGVYDITVELRQRATEVTVAKTGYETSRHWVSLDPGRSTSRNLKLQDIQNAAAGQSLRLMLNLDDPVCGFELYTCRRVRIGSSSRAMLNIDVRPDNAAAQFGVVRAGQEPGVGTTDRLSVPVVAGVETMIEIVIFSGRFPEGFTLNTSLEFR
jgi:Carboxypeptidase regulatory-like domain